MQPLWAAIYVNTQPIKKSKISVQRKLCPTLNAPNDVPLVCVEAYAEGIQYVTPSDLKDALTIVGGALGAFAFFWRVWDTLGSHVRLDLEVFQEPEKDAIDGNRRIVIKVVAENQGLTPKRVAYAALLVGQPSAFIDEIAASLCKVHKAGISIEKRPLYQLFRLKIDTPIRSTADSSLLVPLPFFYLDQAQIGNEKVQFKCVLNEEWFSVENDYRVFLVVFSVEPLGLIRWRLTSDLLRVRKTDPAQPARQQGG